MVLWERCYPAPPTGQEWASILTDGTSLLGDGAGTPLQITPSGVGANKLQTSNTPTAGQLLAFVTGQGMEWVDGVGTGDITAVLAGVGLTGGGQAGAVTLDIGVAEADFPVIPLAKGGSGATDAAGARTSFGLGTAATRTVGLAVGNLVEVIAGGTFPANVIPIIQRVGIAGDAINDARLDTGNTPTSGQVLSYSGGTQDFTWIDGGGTGDITAVRTAGRSGLQGGSLTGEVDLIIDLSNLSVLASTFITDADYFFIQDITDAGNPRKRTTLGSIMAFTTLGESTTSSRRRQDTGC